MCKLTNQNGYANEATFISAKTASEKGKNGDKMKLASFCINNQLLSEVTFQND